MHPDIRRTFLRSLPSFLILAVMLAAIAFLLKHFSTEEIRAYIESAGIWAPLALIAAKSSTIIIAPIGGAPLYPLAGALFGFWPGALYLLIGDAIGGVVSFYISRVFGRRVVAYLFPDNPLLERVLHTLGSVKGLLVARVAFLTFPELVSYAAGLSRIRFWPFFIIFISVSVIPVSVLVFLGTLLVEEKGSWVFSGVLIAGTIICAAGMLLFAKYVRATNPELEKGSPTKEGTMGL